MGKPISTSFTHFRGRFRPRLVRMENGSATAVFSLTNVNRPPTNSADHVAIIDTTTDRVVKFVPTPAGTHGVNWGAKRGGRLLRLCHQPTRKRADDHRSRSERRRQWRRRCRGGTILLANGSNGAGATDGTGGQGVKPLPMTHDGWIQPTVALLGTGRLSPEVEGWIRLLTPAQKDPGDHH